MSDPDQGAIGNQEKGYATEALAKFNCGDFTSCLAALEQLEVILNCHSKNIIKMLKFYLVFFSESSL